MAGAHQPGPGATAPVLDARGQTPPAAVLDAAAQVLTAGGVIGLPTDTVYGLAADPLRRGATDAVFALKGRPRSVTLPVLLGDVEDVALVAAAPGPEARRLMEALWPGALTVVLRRLPGLVADLGGDGATVGVRCPDHPVARAVCRRVGPLATTSANRHGQPPATTATELLAALPGVGLVLDGGPCDAPSSTVVDCTGARPRVLRVGALAAELILAVAAGGRGATGPGS